MAHYTAPAHGIVVTVAGQHGVTVQEMLSHRKDRQLCKARWEAMHRIRKETALSLPQIAHIFRRHHTTIMHGIRRWEEISQ